MVQIKINTPKVQSDEALARIMQMLHYMERIGRLRHGIMTWTPLLGQGQGGISESPAAPAGLRR